MSNTENNHAGNEEYDEEFYRGNKENSLRRAAAVIPIVFQFVRPKTVIDIGCGAAGWLSVWEKSLGAKVYGVDGDYVSRKYLCISEENFHPANLENRLQINQKFDLVECLEVAEHLTPERADSFIEDLTKLGDVILFSAAIIGQGGTNHINEQMQSYWAEKFLRCGYVVIDCIRPKIWNSQQVEHIYKQNILMYAKSTELYRYPELQDYYLKHKDTMILDTIHPELWVQRLLNFQNFVKKVQSQLQNVGQ